MPNTLSGYDSWKAQQTNSGPNYNLGKPLPTTKNDWLTQYNAAQPFLHQVQTTTGAHGESIQDPSSYNAFIQTPEGQRLQQLATLGRQNGWMTEGSNGGITGALGKVVEYGVPAAVMGGIGVGLGGIAGIGPAANGGMTAGGSGAGGGMGGAGSGLFDVMPGAEAAAGGATGGLAPASSGFLGTLGEVGNALKPWSGLIGGGLGLAGTLYATNQATKAAKDAQNSANSAANRLHTTGDSFNNPATGEVSIDPRIRAMREQTLQNLPGYRSELNASNSLLQRNLGETRDRFASNENPFIQARVNPLLAQAASGRGQLSRGMSSRGLGGSSLFSNSLSNYDTQTGRGIADQGALATNDQLTALTGLDTQRYQAALSHIQGLQGLDQQQQSIAAQNLAQELSALGLSQADTAGILQAAGLSIQAGQLQNSAYGRAFDSVGRMLNPSAYQPNITIQS